MGVDISIFLALPFVVWIFNYRKLWGLYVSVIVAVIFAIVHVIFSFGNDMPANLYAPPPYWSGEHHTIGSQGKSIFRMSGYVVTYFCGVILALLMVIIESRTNVKDFVLPRWQYFVLMLIAGFLMLSVVCWPFDDVKNAPDERWNIGSNEWYSAFAQPAWGLGLSMLVFSMRYLDEGNGQRSVIKAFLSVEIWQPLQKLTFLIYMLHPIVMLWYLRDFDTPFYYSIWNAVTYLCGAVVVTTLCAWCLYIFMEQPIALFISGALRKIMTRKKESTSDPIPLRPKMSALVAEMSHHASTGFGGADIEPQASHLESEDESDSDTDEKPQNAGLNGTIVVVTKKQK